MDRNDGIKTEREQSEDYESGAFTKDKNVKSVSDSYEPRKRGLTSIIESLKKHHQLDKILNVDPSDIYSETTTSEPHEPTQLQVSKSRKRRMDRHINNNGLIATPVPSDYCHNNNNHVKNERLSPGTPDTSSRSRSVTPSSASHPDTPPASENPLLTGSRNYSDFMRSLAAKYNNSNPNDYFSAARNGFPPPLDPRFKPAAFPLLPTLTPPSSKNSETKKPDLGSLNPFMGASMFPPIIDMSTTQTLIAMVRTAKEAEIQSLLKNVKRQETSSPLDLSAAAPPTKRPRVKTPSASSPNASIAIPKRAESESPKLHEDISNWTVDDVCNFISGIDICAEYTQIFREQRIDGSGLPLLTEEHLTSTMNMKLGPALKLRSILAKKLGSCSVCLHCSHCHNSAGASPEPANTTGSTSDSGANS
ncbi:lethal(3)malignant brain tumor-like protein 3 isoform X2 [Aethina tumida]|uniref:lethal(3)malignant brain tumor-like protein 3 isoform X2 n=1 Tax=Aethina tumida TaxID=116153 RepID=UPI002147D9CB|nr:lethal(3)malignant brain tumor-like protein 3 isoform X2 [Aethina tumida]